MSTMIMMFVFFFLRMVIELSIAEVLVWIFVLETYGFGFLLIRNHLREKHRKVTRGVTFCYAGIWRDYTYYEKKLLGIKQWYEIDIDWTDEMLNELFDSNYFKSLQAEIISWQQSEDFQRPEAIPKEYLNITKETTDLEIMERLPYKNFKFSDITDQVKEELKKFKVHIGVLYEKDKYKDKKIGFDRICLLTDTDIEKSLKAKKSFAIHEGYPVDIDQVECAFSQIGELLPEIPAFMLTWSENMTRKVIQSGLNAQAINYIKMKVLEKFVYTLRAFSQTAAMTIKQEQTKSNMFYNAWDNIVQEMELIDVNAILGSKTLKEKALEEKVGKYERLKSMVCGLVILIIVLVFFIVVMVISMSPPTTNSVTDITNSTSIISIFNSLLRG